MHLGCFRQLFPRNAALLGRVRFHEAAIHRQVLALYQPHFHTLPHDLLEQLPRTTSTPETARAGSWRTWSDGGSPDRTLNP